MWKWPEYLRNLDESTFTIFFHHLGESWFGKCHPYCSVKSNGCFLIHWVSMARILFNIARILNSQFKRNYLKNEKLFLYFLFHFWNLPHILNILKKKMMVIANVFPNLRTVKNFVTPHYKTQPFGTCLDSRHVKVSRILAKSLWDHFYHFSSSFWGKFIWKISPLVLGEI